MKILNCTSLTEIEISATVKTIKIRAFQGCKNLGVVTFNEGLATIEGGAFMGCPVTEIKIPDSVTTISTYVYSSYPTLYDGAFEDCSKLTSVVIGSGLTQIDRENFRECSALSSITFTGTMEEWNALTLGTDWHYNVPATKVICSDGEVALN